MSEGKNRDKPARKPNILENLLIGSTIGDIPKLVPGIIIIVALVVLAVLLTDMINNVLGFKGLISYILVVIILGILLRNIITMPALLIPGLNFGVKKLLRLGIIMMGIRLSIFEVLKIGAWGIPIVAVCIVVGLVVTTYFSRLLKVPARLATLIAVGTGICGAIAIVATAPGIEAKEKEVSYAIANITIFGLVVMIVYPFIAHTIFNANTTLIGLFLGTAIHETAQVAGSGLIYDQTFALTTHPTVLDVATVTKLVRNAMMALVIPAMTFIYARRVHNIDSKHGGNFKKVLRLFPIFILGFLLLAILRSVGDAGIQGNGSAFYLWGDVDWATIHTTIAKWSGYLLAAAMASVGLSTSFKAMKGLGIKPFLVGLFAATMVGAAAVIMVFIFGRFVSI